MEPFIDATPGFGLANLPWGVFRLDTDPSPRPRIGVALGDCVVDVGVLDAAGLFPGKLLGGTGAHRRGIADRDARGGSCMASDNLNALMALGPPAWAEARVTLQRLLSRGEGVLRDDRELRAAALLPRERVTMMMPAEIGDYTDFYVSE